jgi:alkylation response protein AidB-like acyl-CoA dehydrogenase
MGTGADHQPDAVGLLATANELAPLFRANSPRNEAAGALVPETIAALRSSGLFHMLIPRCFGGAEVNTVEALKLIETVSHADGSTGWVLMATQICTGAAAAYLPPVTAKELFSTATPVVAGQGGPNGRAIVEGNGYRLTGKWGYASGLKHADYIHTGAMVIENGAPRLIPGTNLPDYRTFIVPVREAKLDGNWDVLGLKATGSIDYSIEDVFVPEAFTHSPSATSPNQGGSFYRIGLLAMTSIGHSGFALGIGRRALDEVATLARAKAPRRGFLPPLGETDHFQEGYGDAEAKLRAARAFVYESWGDVQAALDRGEPMTKRQMTLTRLALNHVTTAVAEICAFAYRMGGGVALRDSALQRCLRDMFAGTQHFLTTPTVLRECGKELAGLADGKVWTLLGLVDPH